MKGTLSVMGSSGDVVTTWDTEIEPEVEIAMEQFEKQMGDGFAAFKIGSDGSGAQIRKFDKEAERIIMVPPRVGG
jgi:hypothetical protein